MSYEPKTWETGEIITASGLNHMENAIGALYVTATEENDATVLSVTYNDILTAYNAGKIIALATNEQGATRLKFLNVFGNLGGVYGATFGDETPPTPYTAVDENTPLSFNPDVS